MPSVVSLPDLQTLLACPESAALGAIDYFLPLPDPLILDLAKLDGLPLKRMVCIVPAARQAEADIRQHCQRLAARGLRLQADSPLCAGLPRAREHDAAQGDGTTRKRLLALLGLLAQDADSRELELLLKQDPALSFQLLKLVNSAAFAPNSHPIHNFGQAINLLGRRQLQRWLQLLLYARQQADGPANALLPLAALRAAQMEALSRLRAGDRHEQDMAFLAGVFSLLDVLLAMPMPEIVSALNLDLEVVAALLDRSGRLGEMLALVEMHEPQASALRDVGIDNETYWRSLLQAYHWALQVSRNI
ncbi:HDOD domain-containing protein [Pseudoduganella violaceinigra]|uniref:HDOD domain-containing protein n=1 Tax=Pseudoduganella violaceinigra TaxID=246602 RepID=UPI0003F65FDD|nr:HDOD domain-containing protein [Pseudoduganella violaceinigra]